MLVTFVYMQVRRIRLHAFATAVVLVGCPAPVDDGFGIDLMTDGMPTASATDMMNGTSAESSSDDGASVSVSSTSPSTTQPSTTASDTGDPECGVGATCGVVAPDGWFGPTTWARVAGNGALPDCPEGYPELGPTVLEGYNDPGPAVCGCTCEVDVAAACISYTYDYGDASCSLYQNFLQFSEECHDFTVTAGTYFYMYQQGQPYCQAMKTEELPEVQWDASVRSCKLEDLPTTCGDGDEGVCTPTPVEGFEPSLCIYAQGDLECPAGPYATKHAYYSGAEDTRDCTNCTCGMGSATCSGSMHVFDAVACGGNQVADVPSTGVCTPAVGASVGLNFTGESSCPVATPPEPMGIVEAMGEFTFCCTE